MRNPTPTTPVHSSPPPVTPEMTEAMKAFKAIIDNAQGESPLIVTGFNNNGPNGALQATLETNPKWTGQPNRDILS